MILHAFVAFSVHSSAQKCKSENFVCAKELTFRRSGSTLHVQKIVPKTYNGKFESAQQMLTKLPPKPDI